MIKEVIYFSKQVHRYCVMSKYRICLVGAKLCLRPIILFLDKMVRKPFYRRINILRRLRRKKQYYTAFLGGKAAMPLISGIIKRSIRFIRRNKYYLSN